jgi:lipoprotein NlpI
MNLFHRLSSPRGFGVALGIVFLASGAFAQGGDDAKKCAELASSPDLAIEHCSKAISSGQLAERPLSATHFARGNAFLQKGDFDKAIVDYDAAIRLDPQYAPAFRNRAGAWFAKGEMDKSIADLDAAIAYDPRSAPSFYNRARLLLLKGDFSRATVDLDAALRINAEFLPSYGTRGRAWFYRGQYAEAVADLMRYWDGQKDPFIILWVYLAKLRTGQDGTAELDQAAGTLRTADWPMPVIEMYRGRIDARAVLEAAKADPKYERGRTCEAQFYIAEQFLAQGRKSEACPRSFVEYEGAMAELSKLRK